ncbi:hypothetical protein EIP86_006146 [Pleurotus ostreatoroseus]|nr:hypothetical protein EIP86_006146 [Pleurotus ostreatoroseus]
MSNEVDLEDVRAKVHVLIIQADKEGTLEYVFIFLSHTELTWTRQGREYTPRIVRQKIEEELSLESGVLDTKEYKTAVKEALTDALEQLDSMNVEQSPEKAENPKGKKTQPAKRKSPDTDGAKEAPAKKSKTGQTKTASNGKAKSNSKPAKKTEKPESKKAKPASKAKANKNVRSPSVIESEDEDIQAESSTTQKAKSASPKKAPPKKKPTVVQSDEDEPVPDANPDDAPETASSPTRKQDQTRERQTSVEPKEEAGDKSDSEMSGVIDEPPKRRQKKKKDEKPSKPKRKSKSKDDDLSPNEQEIKRLKSFVTACGVRKVWSKELKDMTEREQISRIKQILADLGMTGRLSVEKAKSIRAKRELAQELEDVKQFEKAVLNGPKPSRKNKSQKKGDDAESAAGESVTEGDDEEESAAPPKKRVSNARASIMAFLGDQSDDE